ncbi:hypothetical protein ACVILL_004106 [Bradyrhizobium sp. USDA 3364]
MQTVISPVRMRELLFHQISFKLPHPRRGGLPHFLTCPQTTCVSCRRRGAGTARLVRRPSSIHRPTTRANHSHPSPLAIGGLNLMSATVPVRAHCMLLRNVLRCGDWRHRARNVSVPRIVDDRGRLSARFRSCSVGIDFFSAWATGIFGIISTAHQAAPTGDGLEKSRVTRACTSVLSAVPRSEIEKAPWGLCVSQSL